MCSLAAPEATASCGAAADASACSLVLDGEGDLLPLIGAFLPLRDLSSLARASRAQRPLGGSEALWRRVAQRAGGADAAARDVCASWRQSVALLARGARLARLPPPTTTSSAAQEAAAGVSALSHSRAARLLGTADGVLHVLPIAPRGGGAGSAPSPPRSHRLPPGAGSVRHVASARGQIYAATWAGQVFTVAEEAPPAVAAGGGAAPPTPPPPPPVSLLISGVAGPIYALCVCAAGAPRLVCGSGDGCIGIYDADAGGTPLTSWRAHDGAVTDICEILELPPARAAAARAPRPLRLATASYDGRLRFWAGDALQAEVEAHRGPVWSVATSHGIVFSAGADGAVCAWRPKAAQPQQWTRAWAFHATPAGDSSCHRHLQILCLRVCGGGLLAGASDGTVFCLGAAEGDLRWVAGGQGAAAPLAGSGDGGGGGCAALVANGGAGLRRLDLLDGVIYAATKLGTVERYALIDKRGASGSI